MPQRKSIDRTRVSRSIGVFCGFFFSTKKLVLYLGIAGVFYPWVSPCAGSSFHPSHRSFLLSEMCIIRSFEEYLQCLT